VKVYSTRHQKAIIHRDLKPSNILVTEIDTKAVPKIIDFGLAKATSQRLTPDTMFTRLGALIGTPEYMSPEQADPWAKDIDTRRDVYSLGVIFYELLVGTLPIDFSDIRGQSQSTANTRMVMSSNCSALADHSAT
jgi:serine/threonine protein kinase